MKRIRKAFLIIVAIITMFTMTISIFGADILLTDTSQKAETVITETTTKEAKASQTTSTAEEELESGMPIWGIILIILGVLFIILAIVLISAKKDMK